MKDSLVIREAGEAIVLDEASLTKILARNAYVVFISTTEAKTITKRRRDMLAMADAVIEYDPVDPTTRFLTKNRNP